MHAGADWRDTRGRKELVGFQTGVRESAQSWPMNHKKLRRLYRVERLQVRRRGGGKRALGTRTPMTIPRAPISAGVWTSYPMGWPMAAASASWRSSTTSRGSAWRELPIPRCLVFGSCANSIPSS
jgi:hypothetical protein